MLGRAGHQSSGNQGGCTHAAGQSTGNQEGGAQVTDLGAAQGWSKTYQVDGLDAVPKAGIAPENRAGLNAEEGNPAQKPRKHTYHTEKDTHTDTFTIRSDNKGGVLHRAESLLNLGLFVIDQGFE